MSNLDGKIVKEFFKEFCKLQGADKTEVIDTMKTLVAMTSEQHTIFNELMKKTIKTIPETKLNRAHASFITYATAAIREGATMPELLEDWQQYYTKGDSPATKPKEPGQNGTGRNH